MAAIENNCKEHKTATCLSNSNTTYGLRLGPFSMGLGGPGYTTGEQLE